MWIKRPNGALGESSNSTVNFLYQEGNVFVMDNHLAAGWAWLNTIDPNESHNLFHIDRHYDLIDNPETVLTEITNQHVNLKELSFQQYTDLRQPNDFGRSWPLFRWDNYILNVRLIYPNIYGATYFATHNDGHKPDDFINHEVDVLYLLSELDYRLESHNNWIVNLDIDYFFFPVSGQLHQQIYTDEAIKEIARNIKKLIANVKVCTISLSPECCGGWRAAFEKTALVCEILEINFIEEFNSTGATFNN